MTEICSIYPHYRLGRFVDRPNRFVMNLIDSESGNPIAAHVPNTGRMTEFLIPGNEFALLPTPGNKLRNRVIATRYQDNWVFLDTVRCNRIVETLLRNGAFEEFRPDLTIRREVRFRENRFDFHLSDREGGETWLEVKSVTLCHNGVALFPDAPTERGLRHMRALDSLQKKNPAAGIYTLYLILNGSAVLFSANPHTHPEYARAFLETGPDHILSYRLTMTDPISFLPSSLAKVPLDTATLTALSRDRGAYLLLLHLPEAVDCTIGSLGRFHFAPGFYLYAGSAMNSLSARVSRHLRRTKKLHWHIDYLLPYARRIRAFPIRTGHVRLEQQIVSRLNRCSLNPVTGFGSSDSPHPAHLFHSSSDPMKNPDVIRTLFDAYTTPFNPSTAPDDRFSPFIESF